MTTFCTKCLILCVRYKYQNCSIFANNLWSFRCVPDIFTLWNSNRHRIERKKMIDGHNAFKNCVCRMYTAYVSGYHGKKKTFHGLSMRMRFRFICNIRKHSMNIIHWCPVQRITEYD